MKIGWFGAGNLDNVYCGNDGGSNIRIPLMNELIARGHTVYWDGIDPGNYEYTEVALANLGLRHESYRYRRRADGVIDGEGPEVGEYDAFIIETRPMSMNEEVVEMNDRIMSLLGRDVPVFIWDQDNWARQSVHPKYRVHENTTLLRPYLAENPEYEDQEYYPYFYSDAPECDLSPEYDLVYVGNRYGREDEMDNFLDRTSACGLSVLVVGNWKRKAPEILDFYPNVEAVGSTPHYSTVPLLSLGKATFDVGKPDYNDIGLYTMRPQEAAMAGRPCLLTDEKKGAHDQTFDKFVIEEAQDLEYVFDLLNNYYPEVFSDYMKSGMLRSVEDAATQLEGLIHERL